MRLHNDQVINFQPFYTFNPRYMSDLRVGAAIIRDIVDLENEKTKRATDAKKNEKAVKEAAAKKVSNISHSVGQAVTIRTKR